MAQKKQMSPKEKQESEKKDRLARRGTAAPSQTQLGQQGRSSVPKQDAFQHLPKRKAPTHLEANRSVPSPKRPLEERPQGESVDRRKPEKVKKRRKRRVNPAKQRKNRRMFLAVTVLFLIIAGVIFSFNALFPIQTFTIQGETQYSEAEILQAAGLSEGENLLSFSLSDAQTSIVEKLPYIEQAEVRRKLPDTVLIRLTPAVEAFCLPWEDGWAILSESQRVLRVDEAQPEGITALFGVTGIQVEVGQKLAQGEEGNGFPYSYEEYLAMTAPPPEPPAEVLPVSSEVVAESSESVAIVAEVPVSSSVPAEVPVSSSVPAEVPASSIASSAVVVSSASVQATQAPDSEAAVDDSSQPQEELVTDLVQLEMLLNELTNAGFSNVTWVDISDPLDIRFRWEDRITVKLGAYNHIQEKLDFVGTLLLDGESGQITAGDRGVLDASGYPVSTDRVWFTPD